MLVCTPLAFDAVIMSPVHVNVSQCSQGKSYNFIIPIPVQVDPFPSGVAMALCAARRCRRQAASLRSHSPSNGLAIQLTTVSQFNWPPFRSSLSHRFANAYGTPGRGCWAPGACCMRCTRELNTFSPYQVLYGELCKFVRG